MENLNKDLEKTFTEARVKLEHSLRNASIDEESRKLIANQYAKVNSTIKQSTKEMNPDKLFDLVDSLKNMMNER